MMNLESLYAALPIAAQNVACSLEGLRIQRTRFTAEFDDLLAAAEARARLPLDEVLAYRNARLASIVRHAYASVPYYRQAFEAHGIDPERVRGIEDLAALPIMTKSLVQSEGARLRSVDAGARNVVTAHTSGTTGAGLVFSTTKAAQREQYATWWRYFRSHGISRETWCGYFGGRSVVPIRQAVPPFWRINHPGRQVMFSGYHLRRDNFPAYVREMCRRRLTWLHGYPSSLSLVASWMIETGTRLDYPVQQITTGAENLLEHQIHAIEQAFGVRPIQHYGMAEGVANFSQCEHGRLHVDEDFACVEFIANPAGGMRVIGTSLTNFAMPLLRYEVGDIARLSDDTCPCGRPGRIVAEIDGRQEDYVLMRNGTRIGRMDHVFKDMTNVAEAQIRQRAPGEISVRVVRTKSYSPTDEARLMRELVSRLGSDMQIRIEYSDGIERTSRGKLRFVVSEIADARIAPAYPIERACA